MALYDQHLHSWYSFDCATAPRANVLRALEMGLGGITFTEHYDTNPEDWPTCRFNDDAYTADLALLREEFGDALHIGRGIEICYQPGRMDRILGFLETGHFDLVLLSVHWMHDAAIHHRGRWDGRTVDDLKQAYLTTVREAAEMCARLQRGAGSPFHVLGHLDLVRRYAKRFLGAEEPLGHPDLVDDILRTCLEADLIPEINTSSLRQGLNEPMPGAAVIERYAKLGGTAIALGSDAHTAADIGSRLDDAAALAQRCGISQLAVFKSGRLEPVPLDASS
jgi:histidinol-phosphatase (PHP family)